MKNIFIKYTIYYILEKGNHSYRNKKLTPILTLVHGKNKTFFSIRLKNLDKNNKKNLTKEEVIQRELEKRFVKSYNEVFKDFEYLQKITDGKLFDNIYKINFLEDESFQIDKYFTEKVIKPFIGLTILTSGLKGIIPELTNKTIKDILNNDKLLKNIITEDINIKYDYDFNTKKIEYKITFNNKIEIEQSIFISDRDLVLENNLINSKSDDKFNIENLNMYQVAFMEVLKKQLNLNKYQINALAVSSIRKGYIGGGVWLKKGYSTYPDNLEYIYMNVVDFFEYVNKNEYIEKAISNFNEFKELIEYISENKISNATDDFNAFSKFIHFDFIINSDKLKNNVIKYIKNVKSYISKNKNLQTTSGYKKIYNILNLIEDRIIRDNRIKLFDLLKIIDNFYQIYINNKNTFLENLKVNMLNYNY